MALYRFEAKVISRGAGRNTVAAAAYRSGHSALAGAAYRAGERLVNEQTGQAYNFGNKRGVLGSEIMLPENAPHWMRDRQALWNAVERVETRINSQLARDFIISIPHELNREQRIEVVREFVREAFVSKGIPADIAWHSPDRADKLNHHAHVMTPFRTVSGSGFSEKKLRSAPGRHKEELRELRVLWADIANRHLEKAGLDVRIDHRSLKDRGIEQVPQPKLGPIAQYVIEKDGRVSKAGNDRRQAAELNNNMAAAKAEHARAVTERAEVVDLMAERAKRQPFDLDKAMRAQHDEQLARQEEVADQLRSAEQAKLRRELAERAARVADEARDPEQTKKRSREHDGGLNSAEARWQIALGENYNGLDPFGSMARAAGAEHAAFIRQQEALKQEAAKEADPLKKQLLENRRMIESADYMAITSDRLSGMHAAMGGVRLETVNNRVQAEQLAKRAEQEREAGAVRGERVSNHALQAIKDHDKAEFWREQGTTQRETRNQLIEQLRSQEAQRAAEQQAKQQTRDQADQLRTAELQARQQAREREAAQPATRQQQGSSQQAHQTGQTSRAMGAHFSAPQAQRQPPRQEQGRAQQRSQEAAPQRQEASEQPFYQGDSEAARLLNEARAAGVARTKEEYRAQQAQQAQERAASTRQPAARPAASTPQAEPAQRGQEAAQQQPASRQQPEPRRQTTPSRGDQPVAAERQQERRPEQSQAQVSRAMSSHFSAPAERQQADSHARPQREQSDAKQERAGREASQEVTDAQRQQIADRHDRENKQAQQEAKRDERSKGGRSR